ncbi:hypothetical protein [Parachlamydia sp. AcF125]|uniref:hypothetical protein n=1 Tax=Parachlamydia sp. AcF125 TaxID=2795736 RepID=UPI001BD89310|nr:hypothetical protein [Parachlamydia sp. AcF125]MBS4167658.1 hypothetical protein [Parachlamydia sp. AcF125]
MLFNQDLFKNKTQKSSEDLSSQIESLEKAIQKNSFKIEELSIRIEAIDREVQTLIQEELKVTDDQLTQFLHTKEHFTPENWNQIQEEKAKLSAKLQTDLQNIRNPQQQQKRYADLAVGAHWVFVR